MQDFGVLLHQKESGHGESSLNSHSDKLRIDRNMLEEVGGSGISRDTLGSLDAFVYVGAKKTALALSIKCETVQPHSNLTQVPQCSHSFRTTAYKLHCPAREITSHQTVECERKLFPHL